MSAVLQFLHSLFNGMTPRDYFAASALQGELACQSPSHGWGDHASLANYCYSIADKMMKARAS